MYYTNPLAISLSLICWRSNGWLNQTLHNASLIKHLKMRVSKINLNVALIWSFSDFPKKFLKYYVFDVVNVAPSKYYWSVYLTRLRFLYWCNINAVTICWKKTWCFVLVWVLISFKLLNIYRVVMQHISILFSFTWKILCLDNL